MSIFDKYAQFYDAVYRDKDYVAECNFIEEIFKSYSAVPITSILDLGCGTGGHALPLAKRGYHVTGIDQSSSMIASARNKTTDTGNAGRVNFSTGDIRHIHLETTFDAVISMFSVVGYMITNEDVLSFFRTARKHLKSGGLFLFDIWSGPTVLSQRPLDRYKIIGNTSDRIIRFSHPEIDLYHHTVDVHYELLHLQNNLVTAQASELHKVRFFFPQEITLYLELTGFIVRNMCPFMHLERRMSDKDWEMTIVAEAK